MTIITTDTERCRCGAVAEVFATDQEGAPEGFCRTCWDAMAETTDPGKFAIQTFPYLGHCPVDGCNAPVFRTPSGTCCDRGHGGVDPE